MDGKVDDMFTILSFLRLCKMYKKLKRSRHSAGPSATEFLSQRNRQHYSAYLEENADLQQDDTIQILPKGNEDEETYSMIHQDEHYEEVDESIDIKPANEADEEIHYNDDDHIMSVIEEKPHVIVEAISHDESYVDHDYQYEISFEVNGEQRHVVLGSGGHPVEIAQPQPVPEIETKYNCEAVEDHEICYEVGPEDQEVILESTEEIQDNVCTDDAEICYEEVDAEQVEEYTIQQEGEPAPQKKRRRRRRRGQNADPEEEEPPKEKKPRIRNFKVKPENLNRQQEGYFGRVFVNMKLNNEEQFLILTRMKRNLFEKLLKLLFRPMSKRAQHIYPEERLSITLL